MNKLPLPIALLSAVIAVVLWYVATLLEGDVGLVEPETPEVQPAFGRTTRETPVVGGRAELDCRQAEERMQALVDDARHCEVDADCTIFDYGYPIQCLTSVARSEITAIRLEYREYEKSCEHRVYYDCPSEPLERQAVCRNDRCEVQLGTLDGLKEQTLEHIGEYPGRE